VSLYAEIFEHVPDAAFFVKDTAGRYTGFITEYTVTDLGEAPEWVDDIIEADEDWQNDLLANDGPDPDRAYDEARDDALMGGR
jgi:hypothetical protein